MIGYPLIRSGGIRTWVKTMSKYAGEFRPVAKETQPRWLWLVASGPTGVRLCVGLVSGERFYSV